MYRKVLDTIVGSQDIEIVELDYDATGGNTALDTLSAFEGEDITAVVIPQPNFFGVLEDVDALTDWAHRHNAMVIAAVNPTSLAILKAPGEWGTEGADIVCGEGQPLGSPPCLQPLCRDEGGAHWSPPFAPSTSIRIVLRTCSGRSGHASTPPAR